MIQRERLESKLTHPTRNFDDPEDRKRREARHRAVRAVLADPRVRSALLARCALKKAYLFNPKERQFLERMAVIGFAPSPKQQAWLKLLALRAGCWS